MNKFIPKQKGCRKFTLILLFVAIGFSQTYASTSFTPFALTVAQQIEQQKVTLKVAEKPLQTILDEIYRQTRISFVFKSSGDLSELSKLSINVKDKSVKEVLNQLLSKTSFTYEIKNNVVMITKKTTINRLVSDKVVIKGKIIDRSTKKPVTGATIIIQGKTIGTISDGDGAFSLTVTSNDKLEISFIGMKTVVYHEPMHAGQIVFVEMEPDISEVDEIVVTGYNYISRADMVGSATALKADDIKIIGKTNVAEMLQGRVAGMVVTNSSSRAGATPKIQIRGQSTLASELGNQSPIWVVDGIIQDDPIEINSSLSGVSDLGTLIGNQVSWLNPNDIESITVLKDASATAIYGSKASNGVIVITTKVPTGDRVSVNYSGGLTINSKPKYSQFDYMNSQERILITEELYNAGLTYDKIPLKQMNTFDGLLRSYMERDITSEQYLKRRAELETVNTDWLDLLTRTAVSHDHSLSLSGNVSDKLSVLSSIGYNKNNGQEIKNSTESLTGRIALTANLNKRLRINFMINGSKGKGTATAVGTPTGGGGATPLEYAKKTSRSIPAFNADGSPCYYDVRSTYRYNDYAVLGYNFLNEMEQTSATNVSGRLGMNFGLSLAITDWLKYEFSGGYTYSESQREVYRGEQSFSIANSYRGYDYGSVLPGSTLYNSALMPHGGTLEQDHATGNSYNIQNKLFFSKTFNEKHRINAMFANEIRSAKSESFSTALWGYLPDRGNSFAKPPKTITPITGSYTETDYGLLDALYDGKNKINDRTDNFVSLFATLAYSYDSKYVFNVNVRNDLSNRFGQDANNRFDPTYSFGVKWNLTQEKFIQNRLKWLNSLSLSVTYGIQGNALLSESPELTLRKGGLNSDYNLFTSTINSIPNPYLTWERTSNWNYAIAGRILNAVNFNVEYYSRESNAAVSQQIGYENGMSTMSINGGMIYNRGVEFIVSFNPISTKDFGLNISINSSKNWNEGGSSTLSRSQIENVNTYTSAKSTQIVKEGYPIGAIWSYVLSHLDDETGVARFKYMDVDPTLAKLDPTLVLTYSGQTDPAFTGGLSLNARYKRLVLTSSFSMLLGNKKRLPNPYSVLGNSYNKIPDSQVNMSKELLKRWKNPGDESTTIYPGIIPGSTDVIVIPGQSNTTFYSTSMWAESNAMIVNGGFLRCNNLRLEYNLGEENLKRIGVTKLVIGASISNLFVIGSKRFNGFDPELGNSVMPRSYSLSLNIGF